MNYDVLIVGAGPAGLSAAIFLGRARRRVLVCDDDAPRNAASAAIHGFLTRDGISPRELRALGRVELKAYGVEFRNVHVAAAKTTRDGLSIRLADGVRIRARAILLATGVRDQLPKIDGMSNFYGRGVYHCPYCDGWEHRNQPMVALGHGAKALGLALALRGWSKDVVVCTNGPAAFSARDRALVAANCLTLRREKIVRLEGTKRLERIVFARGESLDCRALFFNTGQFQRSDLAARLGCEFNKSGGVRTDKRQRTCIDGVYLAGDASRDVQFAIVAAAEGATAAVAINRDLQDQDRGRVRSIGRGATSHGGASD